MAVDPVSVLATVGQPDVDAHPEWCSVDPATLAAIGRQVGHQVRIRRSTTEFALYTVAQTHLLEPPGTVRMGPAGMARLGQGDEFAATIHAQGPDPTRSDAAAEAAGELVERLADGGGRLIAIAPHGGDIEPFTDDQAEQVRLLLAAEGASSWLCWGWRPGGGAVGRWHITSADLAPGCFPQLHTVIGRGYTHAVAFHGSGGSQVLVGGGAASSDLQEAIAEAIRLATGLAVRVATPDDRLGGNDPRNVVNRLTAGGDNGVQIEQPFAARRDHGAAIAKAVVDVYRAV
jgi:phage replication-related protein YjqB (UPF0714/DUF867 family)